MNFPTLTERMEADGIRMMPELTDIIRRNVDNSYTWCVVFKSDINASLLEVVITNPTNAGDSTPDESLTFWHVIANATGIEGGEGDHDSITNGYRDFLDWGREFWEFTDSSEGWNHVQEAYDSYQQTVNATNDLREFLGNKYRDYLYETEFDV